MISKLTIQFNVNDKLRYSYNIGSVFQSIMMESISDEYAEKLHISEVHPYSQHTEYSENGIKWVISVLNAQAKEQILPVFLSDSFDKIYIKDKDITLNVSSKNLFSFSYDELFNKHYMTENTYRYVELEFITPVSFKYDGRYVIFPLSHMLIKNLIRKYDTSSGSTEIYDDALAEHIEKNTDIVEYSLHTVKYLISGIKIPAAIGRITLKINGAPEFIRLMNMLLEYGEYSGTGIKSSMGMGAYRIIERRGKING